MKLNTKTVDGRKDSSVRLAGGSGVSAAAQDNEGILRRLVMANLLWEDNAYVDGNSIATEIARLVPLIDPSIVAGIAIESRLGQGLRHVPLFIAVEMCKYDQHRWFVRDVINHVVTRVDQMAELLSIYWKNGRKPIPKKMRIGLADCFEKFDEYQFGKYKGTGNRVKLKDVMFLVHPKPIGGDRALLYKRIANDELAVPNTWEARLSSGENKKAVWEDLINTRQLGGLAFLRNLSGMEAAGVDRDVISSGFATVYPGWLLPINYIAAAKSQPRWESEIESLMYRGLSINDKLPGKTIFIVDVSGSMRSTISDRSEQTRMEVACSMAVLARELCEDISVYATAGGGFGGRHSTALVPPRRGFALASAILGQQEKLGYGGIFTRQCLEYVEEQEGSIPERIIVFSDSQDCDIPSSRIPSPFGKNNYIVDVSAHGRGVNYKGAWTAEISGWSSGFLAYIAALEGLNTYSMQ